jgi:hypothetical protein
VVDESVEACVACLSEVDTEVESIGEEGEGGGVEEEAMSVVNGKESEI